MYAGRDEELANRLGDLQLFPPVLALLAGQQAVAREAALFLEQLAESKNGLAVMTRPDTANTLKKLMTKDDITKFRVLEMVVKIGQLR